METVMGAESWYPELALHYTVDRHVMEKVLRQRESLQNTVLT